MKKKFFEYYSYSNKDFKEIWNDGLFVFDTSFLLSLYRYKKETSEEFIKILEKISDRIWLPYHIGYEYYKNRLNVIKDIENGCNEIKNQLNSNFNKLHGEINQLSSKYSRFPFEITEKNVKSISKIIEEKRKEVSKHLEKIPDRNKKDDILDAIEKLFKKKVGESYTKENTIKIEEEGEKRYKRKIPPGYIDSNKGDKNKYGDLIIWHQIIDKAKEKSCPIIFVNDDRKEDWWRKSNKENIGPRPELIKEIYLKSKVKFYMYAPDKFLENAGKYLKLKVEKETIDEVKTISEFRSKTYSYGERESVTSDYYPKSQSDSIPWLKPYNSIPDFLKTTPFGKEQLYDRNGNPVATIEKKRKVPPYLGLPYMPEEDEVVVLYDRYGSKVELKKETKHYFDYKPHKGIDNLRAKKAIGKIEQKKKK